MRNLTSTYPVLLYLQELEVKWVRYLMGFRLNELSFTLMVINQFTFIFSCCRLESLKSLMVVTGLHFKFIQIQIDK
jgi:hypothetical protein